jgi:hypothetical protein
MEQLGRLVLEGVVSFFWIWFISKKIPGTVEISARITKA